MIKRPRTELLNLLLAHLTDSHSSSSGLLACALDFFPGWSLLDAGQLANPSPDAFISPSISLTLGIPQSSKTTALRYVLNFQYHSCYSDPDPFFSCYHFFPVFS